jgi:hypothetical protein
MPDGEAFFVEARERPEIDNPDWTFYDFFRNPGTEKKRLKEELQPYLEALKLLKEWSSTLLILQTGILAAVGAFLDKAKIAEGRRWLIASLIFFTVSIVIALNVIGMIPWLTQKLPDYAIRYKDIYQFPDYIGIPVWVLTFGQHLSFLAALVSFLVFAIRALKH